MCVCVFLVGQCGNQVGCRFWDLALREHAHVNKVSVHTHTHTVAFSTFITVTDPSPNPVTDVIHLSIFSLCKLSLQCTLVIFLSPSVFLKIYIIFNDHISRTISRTQVTEKHGMENVRVSIKI